METRQWLNTQAYRNMFSRRSSPSTNSTSWCLSLSRLLKERRTMWVLFKHYHLAKMLLRYVCRGYFQFNDFFSGSPCETKYIFGALRGGDGGGGDWNTICGMPQKLHLFARARVKKRLKLCKKMKLFHFVWVSKSETIFLDLLFNSFFPASWMNFLTSLPIVHLFLRYGINIC